MGRDLEFLGILLMISGNRTGRPIEAQLSMDANLRRRVRMEHIRKGCLEILHPCTYEFPHLLVVSPILMQIFQNTKTAHAGCKYNSIRRPHGT